MGNRIIYFGGTFAGNNLKELDSERQNYIAYLSTNNFKVLSPLRGVLNLDGMAHEISAQFTPNEIVHRDLDDINRADVVLLNMTSPSIGSACELMYCNERSKPVIIVSENERVTGHPWINSLATKVLPNMVEALDFIVYNYSY